jgi:hypothetical protein
MLAISSSRVARPTKSAWIVSSSIYYHSFFASMDDFFSDLFKLYRVAMPENLFGKAHSLVCTIPTSIAAICTE